METDVKEQLESIFSNYNGAKGDLIPILQKTQERFGYLPENAMAEIAKFLQLPPSTVFGVSTFYAQFKFVPMGKQVLKVCRGTACHVRGANQIQREFERHLGIQPGETTEDREYTLETVACIGACALAPTMMVNEVVQGKMTIQKVRDLLKKGKKT
jgi:NADH-quinone oxidoreductase subunit E